MLRETPVCEHGWTAPDFTLADPDGVSYTMSEQLGYQGLLVAFIANHCPYVTAIADRLSDDALELQGHGINVLAIMSNDYQYAQVDGPPFMKIFAKQHRFTFPYLIDEAQEVGRAYGAVCTPDFFGFNKNGTLQYRGRLDDAGMGNSSDRVKDLVNAMKQIASTGSGPQKHTPSVGCSIKWS